MQSCNPIYAFAAFLVFALRLLPALDHTMCTHPKHFSHQHARTLAFAAFLLDAARLVTKATRVAAAAFLPARVARPPGARTAFCAASNQRQHHHCADKKRA